MTTPIAKKLLYWYGINKRDLPWRDDPNPYAVWVAEVMAQQTRLETVTHYFERWMARFPTIAGLALASQQDVLTLWEGLGYYSRARNLHKAAQVVIEEHGGELPGNVKALQSLPGIGRYTAGAIASLAFGLDEAVVDGNVKRVMARLFTVDEMVDVPVGERKIWALAAENLPLGKAADYNQALMDLGAMVCLSNNPDCERCPLRDDCQAYASGRQAELPYMKPKAGIPHYTVTAAVIRKGARVLIAQRPEDGLLGGMWEFPGGKLEDGEDLRACLKREIKEELGVKISVDKEVGVFQHAYTHFKVTLHAFDCELRQGQPKPIQANDIRWVTLVEFDDYPMGKLDRQISQRLQQMNGRIP